MSTECANLKNKTWCTMLQQKLKQVELPLHVNKSHVMRTKRDETVCKFFQHIGNSEVSSMQYKWKLPLG
jgi:hypothetical protein